MENNKIHKNGVWNQGNGETRGRVTTRKKKPAGGGAPKRAHRGLRFCSKVRNGEAGKKYVEESIQGHHRE